tara:strand:- start:490 stop:1116 length:627 start_codon:yes stop_codon:yes gene_type:complete
VILSVSGEKGGTGKTTLATNLAPLVDDLLVVDTDQQGSFSMWSAMRSDNKDVQRVNCIQKFGDDLANEIRSLSDRYDNIIVDVAGKDSTEMRASMLVSDIIIFPLNASQFDVWTVNRLNKLVEDARGFNKELKAFYMLNRLPTNTDKEEKEALELLQGIKNIKNLNAKLFDRKAYRTAAGNGLSVVELKPTDKKAMNELMAVYKCIYN